MKRLVWDATALVTFAGAAAGLYLFWAATGYQLWICYSSAVIAVIVLAAWGRWLWSRLSLPLTKFFLFAAGFDLLMEGFLHPVHPETVLAKLSCELMLFGVFTVYLFGLRPIDVRLARSDNRG
ncbi:hypothetical protein HQ590_04305 [bacterium]|nr:hypothetical protein [bacterium]